MISVSKIIEQCESKLDAEGFDRYTFDRDFRPAINYSINWLVSVFNSVFSQNKLSEENLRELMRVKCWKASTYSRVNFDSSVVGEDLWTIVAIYPKCTTTPSASVTATPNTKISYYLPDLSYLESDKSAKRLTLEEYNRSKKNPFEAGNIIVTEEELIDYSYVNFADYNGGYTSSTAEIQISPPIPLETVAIAYLKLPTEITTVNDTVEFPETLTGMVVEGVLNFLSVKQGSATTLYGTTKNAEQQLITLMA